jgi:hypothetical protein
MQPLTQTQIAERKSLYVQIEEVRENNKAGLFISSFAAQHRCDGASPHHGPRSVDRLRKGGLRRSENFRVTARTAYTVTLLGTQLPPTPAILIHHLWAPTMSAQPSFSSESRHRLHLYSPVSWNTYTFGIYAKERRRPKLYPSHVNGIRLRTTRARRPPPLSSASTKSEPTTPTSPGYPRRTTARTCPPKSI